MSEQTVETSPPREASWAQVWQLPVLLLGVLLLSYWFYSTLTASREPLDFQGNLNSAEQFLEAGEYEQARQSLDRIASYIDHGTRLDHARLHQLMGDLLYLSQRAQNGDREEDHRKIVERYSQARELGQAFGTDRLRWWASTLIALQRDTEAMAKLDELKDEPASVRYGLLREMIEARRARPNLDPAALTPMLDRFVTEVREGEFDRTRRREADIWAVDQQAQLALDVGDADGAIDLLHLRMMKLNADGGDVDLGPPMLRLAQAYQRQADYTQATHHYRNAQRRLISDDPRHAEVLVGLAQIDQFQTGDFRQAHEKFTEAELRFPPGATPAYFDALVGRAYSEAHLGSHREAIENFGRAVKYFLAQRYPRPEQMDQLASAIRAHYDLARENDDELLALDYLSLLTPLYGNVSDWPARLMLDFAVTHESVGQQLMQQAAELGEASVPGQAPEEAIPTDERRELRFQQASINYRKAAEFYRMHAREMAPTDEVAHGRSLWRAAESYDQAQLWRDAIDVYAEFRKSRPNDSKHVAAILRLGLAHKADMQFEAAIQRFQELTSDFSNAPEAYEALVPMAQCQMALGRYDDAKRVLLHVVTNHPAITFDSQPYREAVIALGKLHYRVDEFEEAVERLTEAVTRYADAPDIASLRFRLADSYRRSVNRLDDLIADPSLQSRRPALVDARTQRLEQALVFYSQAIREMERRGDDRLSRLDRLYLRNAYFYRADCAYDLGRFEQAIDLYDLAAKRWENHPSALVALVQIVNSHCELGQFQQASVANLRARELLRRIPDEAFSDPLLPMTRQHWEAWQRWTEELDMLQAQANVMP